MLALSNRFYPCCGCCHCWQDVVARTCFFLHLRSSMRSYCLEAVLKNKRKKYAFAPTQINAKGWNTSIPNWALRLALLVGSLASPKCSLLLPLCPRRGWKRGKAKRVLKVWNIIRSQPYRRTELGRAEGIISGSLRSSRICKSRRQQCSVTVCLGLEGLEGQHHTVVLPTLG